MTKSSHETGLDVLYRALEGQHLVYPEHKSMLHDPWRVDLREATGRWFDHNRFLHFGPLRITVDVSTGPQYRADSGELRAIAQWLSSRSHLPTVGVCGSHSPLSPRFPYSGSDVDLVCFIPCTEFFADIEHWCEVASDVQALLPTASQVFGRDVGCGFLLQEFRTLPCMLDCVDIFNGELDRFSAMTPGDIMTELQDRWNRFLQPTAETTNAIERVMAALSDMLGGDRVVQIVSDGRWHDVTWSMVHPRWIEAMSSHDDRGAY